jgi:hypothetical protein
MTTLVGVRMSQSYLTIDADALMDVLLCYGLQ